MANSKTQEARIDARRRWHNGTVTAAVLLTGFGAAHLIDDFLYGIPGDFGLSNELAQFLALAYFSLTGTLLVLTMRGHKVGYLGNLGLGIFLIAADITKHGAEGLFWGPWRSGLVSRFLAFGVMLSAAALAVCSYKAWQWTRSM